MSSKEIEEYRKLLWQLELTFEEESDDPSEDTPQIVQYFQRDGGLLQSYNSFTDFDVF